MSSREQQTSFETSVPVHDTEQLACAQKRIEALEEKQLRQELEIRRLEAALRKASSSSSASPSDSKAGSDATSCSTKSVEEMTSGAPSSQLSPRSMEFGLSLTSGIEGLAAAVAAAAATVPPMQQGKEPVAEVTQEEASEVQSTSIPSTPEMPVRELPNIEMSGVAVNFFNQWQSKHSGTSCAEAVDCAPSTASPAPPQHLPAVASVQTPPPEAAAAPAVAWYRVSFCGGICVRSAPDIEAPRTGLMMPCNEVFAVSEVLLGVDKRQYLRLADGRGWVFDDSALLPNDPAVVRGHWAPARQEQAFIPGPPQEVQPPAMVLASHPATLHQPTGEHFEAPAVAPAAGSTAAAAAAPPCGPPCQQVYLPAPMGVGSAGQPMATPMPPQHTPNTHPVLSAAPQSPPVLELPQQAIQAPVVWYRVAFCGGISARVAPDVDAPRTGATLLCHEVFAVAESVLGADQRVYLRLLDGRGWVFDDSMLVPEDPAVVRMEIQVSPAQCPPAYGVPAHPVQGPPPGAWQVGPASHGLGTTVPGAGRTNPDGTLRRWTRGKRGGVKKNRRRHQNQTEGQQS